MQNKIGPVALLLTVASYAAGTGERHFPLYRGDKSCVCINTTTRTKTVRATEVRMGRYVYQVFWSRATPKRELFRVRVGTVSASEAVKLWKYGIADEADFNGDGVPDHSWYGGDDTSFSMYLFLSVGRDYRRVDVLKTIQNAWKKRFHQAAPDFGEAGGEYEIANTALERSDSGLELVTEIRVDTAKNAHGRYQFRIAEADFQ